MFSVALNQPGICVVRRNRNPSSQIRDRAGFRAWPGFVAVLRLDLEQRNRKILVRRVLALHQEGEHLFVGGPKKVVGFFAVLKAERCGAVLVPAPGCFVWLSWEQRRKCTS